MTNEEAAPFSTSAVIYAGVKSAWCFSTGMATSHNADTGGQFQ